MAANATFALKPGVWFLRVRFVIFAPDSRREPSPPSGRKSTQPTVQILEASSTNEEDCARVLAAGGNVAVVFHGGLPASYLGHRVIDGDLHDLRHLDERNVIVGLSPKGLKARRDISGFVVRT